jgi:3-isopropylmalate dehydrogenase
MSAVSKRFGHAFDFEEESIGGVSIEQHGVALRDEVLVRARASDAVLLGAVGDPKYDDPAAKVRPEQAILGMRQGLELFANIRPVRVFESLIGETSLKPEVVRGTDIVVVRELTGGIYFGKPQRRWVAEDGRRAVDTMAYSEAEVERILHVAFGLARKRRKRVTSVDKANILDTSRLWREVASEVAQQYPDITFENVLVDACAMHLINRPTRFDVIVTGNMFGDILTDEAAMLTGSLGMMQSASLGRHRPDGTAFGLYEPIHGSAPDIAGQDRANPIGMIMSVAMMMRLSLGLDQEAVAIETAVEDTMGDGYRTLDMAGEGTKNISTSQMGTEIAGRIEQP